MINQWFFLLKWNRPNWLYPLGGDRRSNWKFLGRWSLTFFRIIIRCISDPCINILLVSVLLDIIITLYFLLVSIRILFRLIIIILLLRCRRKIDIVILRYWISLVHMHILLSIILNRRRILPNLIKRSRIVTLIIILVIITVLIILLHMRWWIIHRLHVVCLIILRDIHSTHLIVTLRRNHGIIHWVIKLRRSHVITQWIVTAISRHQVRCWLWTLSYRINRLYRSCWFSYLTYLYGF